MKQGWQRKQKLVIQKRDAKTTSCDELRRTSICREPVRHTAQEESCPGPTVTTANSQTSKDGSGGKITSSLQPSSLLL